MDNSYTSGPFLAPSYATTPLFDPGEQLDQWTMDPMLSWQPYAYPMQGSNAEVGITACNAPLFLGAASVEHHMQQPLEPHPSAFGNRVPVQYGSYQMGDQQGTINNMPNIDIASPVEAFSSATTAPTFGSMYNLHAQTTFVPINGVGVVSNSGRYPCTYPGCDQSVKSAGDLGRHMKEHEDGPKEFECPIRDCPRQGEKGFARKDKMKDHLKSRHKLSSL